MTQNMSVQHCVIDHCRFSNVDAGTGITLFGAILKNTVFRGILGDWTFSDCKITNCEFKTLDGALVIFDRGTELTGCDLSEIDIEHKHDAYIRNKITDTFKSWPQQTEDDDDDDDDDDEEDDGEDDDDDEDDDDETVPS
jgi:hypothetical protein